MRAVQVFWEDAGGKHGWEKLSDAEQWFSNDSNFLIDTVGLLIAENDKCLVLAMGTGGDTVLNVTRIPKANIIQIKELTYGEEDAN